MTAFFMALGILAAYFIVAFCLIGFCLGVYVWVQSLGDQRRKQRRGGMLERDVFARVVEEAETYTREAARR